MGENRGKRKRGETELETEKKKKTKRGKKEKEEEQTTNHGDDVVVIEEEEDGDDEIRERRSEDVLGKREQQNEGEREREEEEVMKRRRKEEEEKKKRFECGICLELMSWEKEPRLLPCCGLSFCSLCLNKLFLLQNPSSFSSPSPPPSSSSSPSPSSSSTSSSSSPSSFSSLSSPSSSSSSSLKGVKCPVCREMNECESVESLSMNYLIPETIDVLLSSNLISFSNQSGFFSLFLNFLSFFPLFSLLRKSYLKLLKNILNIFEKTGDGGMNFETCGEQTQMFCSDCKMFICDSCDPSHTSTLFSQNHKRSERDGVEGGGRRRRLEEEEEGVVGVMGLENLKKRECSKHPSETICGYCFQCSSFVCTHCILETHNKHNEKVKSIEESILEKRNEVVKIGEKIDCN